MTENDAKNPLQRAHEGVRDYLERRDRELSAEIAALHDQIAPREAELAEVRRAKGSLGIPPVVHQLAADGLRGDGAIVGSTQLTVDRPPPRKLRQAAGAPSDPNRSSALHASAYEKLTMKELVVKALHRHFHNGATTKQLREFFRDAWGRDIARANLSPQLSRLRQDHLINWRKGVWSLNNESHRSGVERSE